MLSVVIITCNRVDSLLPTILSCRAHVSMDWELIVVDNGSSDGTQVQVENLCERENIVLQYCYLDENRGVAGARNIGYQMARGDAVYFIDDDAVVDKEGYCLDKAYKYLLSREDVQIISNEIWDELWGGILPEITAHGQEMKTGAELRCFIGCSHLIKKDSLFPEKLYPDNLFYGGEEFYLSYLVYMKGRKVVYYDGLSVEHHPSKKTRASNYDLYRNRVLNWFIVKEYIYPSPYLMISRIVYWYRIIKLANVNPRRLMDVRRLHKERYDKKYECKYTVGEFKSLTKKFGFRYLV